MFCTCCPSRSVVSTGFDRYNIIVYVPSSIFVFYLRPCHSSAHLYVSEASSSVLNVCAYLSGCFWFEGYTKNMIDCLNCASTDRIERGKIDITSCFDFSLVHPIRYISIIFFILIRACDFRIRQILKKSNLIKFYFFLRRGKERWFVFYGDHSKLEYYRLLYFPR